MNFEKPNSEQLTELEIEQIKMAELAEKMSKIADEQENFQYGSFGSMAVNIIDQD